MDSTPVTPSPQMVNHFYSFNVFFFILQIRIQSLDFLLWLSRIRCLRPALCCSVIHSFGKVSPQTCQRELHLFVLHAKLYPSNQLHLFILQRRTSCYVLCLSFRWRDENICLLFESFLLFLCFRVTHSSFFSSSLSRFSYFSQK